MIIATKELKNALGHITSSVKTSTALEIYKYVHMKGKDGELLLKLASESAYIFYPMKYEGPDFECCFPLRQLSIIAGSPMKGASIDIQDNGYALVKQGNSKMRVPLRDTESFPVLLPVGDSNSVTHMVPCDSLQKALKSSYTTTGKGIFGKYMANVISITPQKDFLLFQSCDGSQISLARIKSEGEASPESYLMPDSAVPGLLNFLKDEKSCHIKFANGRITFTSGVSVLSVNLVSGKFPDVRRAMDFETNILFDFIVSEFKEALNRVLPFAPNGLVRVRIAENEMVLHAQDKNMGEIVETMTISKQDHTAEFGINGKFFFEYLQNLDNIAEFKTSDNPKEPVYINHHTDECLLRFMNMKFSI